MQFEWLDAPLDFLLNFHYKYIIMIKQFSCKKWLISINFGTIKLELQKTTFSAKEKHNTKSQDII